MEIVELNGCQGCRWKHLTGSQVNESCVVEGTLKKQTMKMDHLEVHEVFCVVIKCEIFSVS